MPGVLKMFLSINVVYLLIAIYLTSGIIVVAGFKWRNIKRRKDVKIRAFLMLGTFVFLSHSIGVMALSIMFLFLKINQIEITMIVMGIMVLFSVAICDTIYAFISNYLWDRLAIGYDDGIKLSIASLVVVTPWYYVVNFF